MISWARDSSCRKAPSGSLGRKSPYEIWHGETGKLCVVPLLQLCFPHRKRMKSDKNGAACFLLGPAPNYPRGTMFFLHEQTRTDISPLPDPGASDPRNGAADTNAVPSAEPTAGDEDS